MLGNIMNKYKKSVAVAGSHGKTTTTSLISIILEYSGLDPTILIGGELDEIGGNIKIGNSPHFITEACEYVESFLKFNPFIGIILNIDEDHLDYFKNIDHIKDAFRRFADKIPANGFLIANIDDMNVKELLPKIKCNILTYGLCEESDFTATDIEFNEEGFSSFKVLHNGKTYGHFQLRIPGYHNIYNSLASIATSYILGVLPQDVAKYIPIYKGAHRRFEMLGEVKGAKVIDDYAHHPAEIRATLEAAKNYPHRDIWCIFQPHTYTRTQALLNEFAESFDKADHVIITDIYAARELDEGKVHSSKMVELMQHPDVRYIKDFCDIADFLYNNIKPQDIVITMGAGDVYEIGRQLLDKKN
ncbi:UDP-N-acetylmuramate--L-alanine ligase [Alkaliphilus pronyensis]|nr:UDP-N-acetylmuramate--L-alanine ligase [Alkaliphilus pronyensis]